ncbi:MAG: ExbD/TolR family protein [Helicobacteraceae bacterium]
MRRRPKQDEESTIDMTPMLDIVFIMLIFFIVTTSFVKESGLDVNRPVAKTSQKKDKGNNIMIAISKEGNIWLDRRIVDIDAVKPNLQRISANMADPNVIIQSDADSKTGILVEVMDKVKLAGIHSISIAAKNPQ